MTAYSKYNLVYRLQKWMDTVAGQTFLNYAYSWGASIVILGALFKLTHLPGANIMLFIGMGTEVFVFFISAFDRPFDKTADGRVMPTRLTEEFLETILLTKRLPHSIRPLTPVHRSILSPLLSLRPMLWSILSPLLSLRLPLWSIPSPLLSLRPML